MSRIFISYRRDDTGGYAGRLNDRLSEAFGAQEIFRDIEDIAPGVDFVQEIEREVAACDVLLVVIGRQWTASVDAHGRSRLQDPHDFVRLEIAAALRRNIRV